MTGTTLSEGREFPFFYFSDVLGTLNEYEKKHAPGRAFYAGNLDLLKSGGRVSVVGTRKPTSLGAKRAHELTRMLIENGITIVSGLAEGVDAIAHETAIKSGGRTIAVTGTPLSKPYPKSNIHLFEEMIKNQLVISQFPEGSPFQPKNFPIRNRTMALISHATIIVEAFEKSGTIHQGWEALRLGRPLFLMESLTLDKTISWPQELIGYGARILRKDNFDDLIYSIPAYFADDEIFLDAFC